MDLKIFSLAPMQTAIAVTVFVKCPEIEYIKEMDVLSWLKHFSNQLYGIKDEERAAKYEHCCRLLVLTSEIDSRAELLGVYNVPVRTGNEIMFIIQFKESEKRNLFMNAMKKLDAELSS